MADWLKDAARPQGGEQVALGHARQSEPREMQDKPSDCTPRAKLHQALLSKTSNILEE